MSVIFFSLSAVKLAPGITSQRHVAGLGQRVAIYLADRVDFRATMREFIAQGRRTLSGAWRACTT
eukprot:4663022-Pleurochrysis_carterae.AAC.1